MYNVGIVLGVLVLVPLVGWSGLVIGTVLGALLHMLARAQSMWRYGFRPQLSLTFSPEIRETAWLMLPKMAQIGAWQAMLLWFILLASPRSEADYLQLATTFRVSVSLMGSPSPRFVFAVGHLSAHSFKGLGHTNGNWRIVWVTTGAALAAVAYPLVNFFRAAQFDETAVHLSADAQFIPSQPWRASCISSRAHRLKKYAALFLIHIVISWSPSLPNSLFPRFGLYSIPIAFP
jgi:hypothetical protein